MHRQEKNWRCMFMSIFCTWEPRRRHRHSSRKSDGRRTLRLASHRDSYIPGGACSGICIVPHRRGVTSAITALKRRPSTTTASSALATVSMVSDLVDHTMLGAQRLVHLVKCHRVVMAGRWAQEDRWVPTFSQIRQCGRRRQRMPRVHNRRRRR